MELILDYLLNTFNVTNFLKTKLINFSSHRCNQYPSTKIYNASVELVKSFRYFGIDLDNKSNLISQSQEFLWKLNEMVGVFLFP